MFSSIVEFFRQKAQFARLYSTGVVVRRPSVLSGVSFAGKATLEPYCRLIGDDSISIGDNFYLNASCHLLGDIVIGDNVSIGPQTVIWGRDHGIRTGTLINRQPHVKAPVRIGNDVWIGANVTILKGVTLGDGVVVGAGSVVSKSLPPNSIAVGNPARVIKYRT